MVGLVGDELHDKIGGCSGNSSTCPFSEVRSCYGCLYYRPLRMVNIRLYLNASKEVDELIAISDGVGNSRNPLILIHETTQFEIESVIARCRFHQEQVKSNENHFEHFQAFIEEKKKNGSNSTCLLILPKHGMIISG